MVTVLVEQLSSVSDDLAGLEPWRSTGAEVRELVTSVQRARTCLDAAMSRLSGAADDMGLPTDDGATSITTWLANLTGMSRARLPGWPGWHGCPPITPRPPGPHGPRVGCRPTRPA
ncbi:hypothetical protein [Aeromicrobium sp. A1-2]|uniref:hypothetical protein n=1 Tax=Aeromicrobium sp. A1-2 TaxID=2107713 RepID=UPI0013C30372|nr:hypothetical protein [Aeromicrobium sp. A1-2]